MASVSPSVTISRSRAGPRFHARRARLPGVSGFVSCGTLVLFRTGWRIRASFPPPVPAGGFPYRAPRLGASWACSVTCRSIRHRVTDARQELPPRGAHRVCDARDDRDVRDGPPALDERHGALVRADPLSELGLAEAGGDTRLADHLSGSLHVTSSHLHYDQS